MEEKQPYKGLVEHPDAKIFTAVCPASPGERIQSQLASFANTAPKLFDVWELVNDGGPELLAIPLRQGVMEEYSEEIVEVREQAGIPTQRFQSHRVF